MQNSNAPTLRRSSRLPINIPVLVTSLEPNTKFSEVCETLVVNAHGCAMRSPVKLEAGVPLHFHNQDGREARAQVVACQPVGDRPGWMLSASFDRPENFWGLSNSPQDWSQVPRPTEKFASKLAARNGEALPPDVTTASMKLALDRIRKQLSDDHLKVVLAELVKPLQDEVSELKEKLAQSGKKNRFDVSLSQIPPELEEQLELRLKKELGPQVLKEAREQSEHVLESAKAAIAQKTTTTHEEFRQKVARELQAVEQRTQTLSTDYANNLREHLNRGIGELHQEVIDSGNRLKKLSEDLLGVMEHKLGEEHGKRTQHLEQVRAAVGAESVRLREQITDLDRRMGKLDESAQRLESGLDQRLSQMASDAVRTARGQMEAALDIALQELATNNAQELSHQLDEASANLKIIQKGIESSLSESLRNRAAETLQSFEASMEDIAQRSTERWKSAFAGGLSSLIRMMGEQFVLQAESGAGVASEKRAARK